MAQDTPQGSVQLPSVQEGTEVNPSVQEGTAQEATIQSPQQGNDADGAKNVTTQDTIDPATKQKWAKLESEYTKLKKDYEKIKPEYEQAQQLTKAQAEWILKKEDRTKEYLVEQGYSEEQITQTLQQIKEQNPNIWEAQKDQPKTDTKVEVDPNKLAADVMQRVKMSTYLEEQQKKFFEAVPEMNPQNIANKPDLTDEDRQQIKDHAAKVDNLASAVMQSTGMEYGDALIASHKFLINRLGGEDAVKQEGFLEGIAVANADKASNVNIGGVTNGGSATPGLSPEQSAFVEKWGSKIGVTKEDYLKYGGKK